MTLTQKVYKLISQVPAGKVTTYGDIGKKLGTKAYRGIGQILHRNPDWPEVPCHRVVMKDGSLAPNYGAGGPRIHRERLEKEGVTFIDDKVELERYRFDLTTL